MGKKINKFIRILKEDLGLLLSISLGVFLFVLFFQPFPIEKLDFNNRLVFVAGLSGIVFLFIALVRFSFHLYIIRDKQNREEFFLPTFIGGFIILFLSSISFTFYLHYVGSVSITFLIMFKVVLICLAAPITLKLHDRFHELKKQIELLLREKMAIQGQVKKYEEDYLNKSIELFSENNAESIKLPLADVALIRSADNYVELIFKEAGVYKKKLIRNTLKNIEQQIKPYTIFNRCHRTSIVNLHAVDKLKKTYNNYWLIIKGLEENVPVSRQYIQKLKEAL
ncbi:MAG: LytTR family DNA-binding domain-containing protein [Bacteroidales bacterium]|nr:LytTR family DNA-binding domain-containing protein [Bacteroidales bacterium]